MVRAGKAAIDISRDLFREGMVFTLCSDNFGVQLNHLQTTGGHNLTVSFIYRQQTGGEPG
ncbi:hypothetical protein DSL64_04235 [Dyadobacter luteus]|uniref:Uncharacterized protein n=1 Tax=Dyadobacter luteus TaxID=2259619 RepID=A0A3D8YGH0_9BACT|nr:hypothetical protein DSL64_04235 [Dyadobacter luteus]